MYLSGIIIPDLTTSYTVLGGVGIVSYLIGSIPFGLIMARIFGLGDLRKIGSGNIGTTNVLRTGHKLAAFLTLICDSGKGAASVLLARYLIGEDAAYMAGLFAFFGHCFPIYLQFHGGKGVATFLGTLLALSPLVGIFACASWLITALVFRISSLCALIAAVISPIAAYALDAGVSGICAGLAILIWVRHAPNIRRLLQGKEPRIGDKSHTSR